MLVLLRNSARDGRKGDKLAIRWLGPYKIAECLDKNTYRLLNPASGRTLKKIFNGCRYNVFTFCIAIAIIIILLNFEFQTKTIF